MLTNEEWMLKKRVSDENETYLIARLRVEEELCVLFDAGEYYDRDTLRGFAEKIVKAVLEEYEHYFYEVCVLEDDIDDIIAPD